MKRVMAKMARREDNDMCAEYDFRGGVRGKHYRAMQAGYTVTVHNADGVTITKDVALKKGVVAIEPDLQTYFPDSKSVNATLRTLIRLVLTKHAVSAKEAIL